ncbi:MULTISPECIES: hypothetical protein [unclassified Microcoleus]|uniref:hypothetical protein n=1 Tax=unclassified Microcoleus TaxID=2642155 RepID=UPI0025D7B171|nr:MULTISPECIES: hypothetical protein [unclassified Microcoleus]
MRTLVRNILRTEVRTTNEYYRGQSTGHYMISIFLAAEVKLLILLAMFESAIALL